MWKKLKKFYKYNRIYCILMFICLFCFLLMGTGIIVYFVDQTSTSKYGTRVDDVKNFDTDKMISNLENSFNDPKIKNKSVRLQGRIIYVDLTLEKETTNQEIQNICVTSLASISEEEKAYFDMQFVASRDELPAYLGSKNHTKTNITWGNYAIDNTTTTTTTSKKK